MGRESGAGVRSGVRSGVTNPSRGCAPHCPPCDPSPLAPMSRVRNSDLFDFPNFFCSGSCLENEVGIRPVTLPVTPPCDDPRDPNYRVVFWSLFGGAVIEIAFKNASRTIFPCKLGNNVPIRMGDGISFFPFIGALVTTTQKKNSRQETKSGHLPSQALDVLPCEHFAAIICKAGGKQARLGQATHQQPFQQVFYS